MIMQLHLYDFWLDFAHVAGTTEYFHSEKKMPCSKRISEYVDRTVLSNYRNIIRKKQDVRNLSNAKHAG